MIIFLGTPYCVKTTLWGLSNIPNCPSYHASQWPLVQKNIKYFWPWCFCNVSYALLSLVSFNILVSSFIQKCILNVQPSSPNVSIVLFQHLVIACCHFVIPCWHFHLFLALHFILFCYHWHCLSVFLLLTKWRSSLNKNVISIWIFTKDV